MAGFRCWHNIVLFGVVVTYPPQVYVVLTCPSREYYIVLGCAPGVVVVLYYTLGEV